MKKASVILIIAIIFSSIVVSAKNISDLPLLGKLIVIDVGHGGKDPGSVVDDIYEKDVNLNIAKFLENSLIKLGASVILTREDDYDLASPNALYRKKSDFDNRILLINESNADIYLSIHMNYLDDSRYGGTSVFYLDDEYLANCIQDKLNDHFDFDRKIDLIPSTYMYSKLNIPGVLIECGFLSNEDDRVNFLDNSYLKEYTYVLANSLIDYFN